MGIAINLLLRLQQGDKLHLVEENILSSLGVNLTDREDITGYLDAAMDIASQLKPQLCSERWRIAFGRFAKQIADYEVRKQQSRKT